MKLITKISKGCGCGKPKPQLPTPQPIMPPKKYFTCIDCDENIVICDCNDN